jgi:CheY-like chemotaxis protein
MFLSTLKRLLQDEPYELHCESTDKTVLEYLKKNRPDLFLLDIEMPGMGGYELAKQIKDMGQSAPIIFISANSDQEYIDNAKKAGAADMLIKPLRRAQLMETIMKYIK